MGTITVLVLTALLAVDLPDNEIDPRFGDFVGVEVNACAIDPVTDTIFVGGNFSMWQRPDSSVVARANLIAFGPDGRVLDWAPATNGQVLGMEQTKKDRHFVVVSRVLPRRIRPHDDRPLSSTK